MQVRKQYPIVTITPIAGELCAGQHNPTQCPYCGTKAGKGGNPKMDKCEVCGGTGNCQLCVGGTIPWCRIVGENGLTLDAQINPSEYHGIVQGHTSPRLREVWNRHASSYDAINQRYSQALTRKRKR